MIVVAISTLIAINLFNIIEQIIVAYYLLEKKINKLKKILIGIEFFIMIALFFTESWMLSVTFLILNIVAAAAIVFTPISYETERTFYKNAIIIDSIFVIICAFHLYNILT